MRVFYSIFGAFTICFLLVSACIGNGDDFELVGGEAAADWRKGNTGEYYAWVEGEKVKVTYSRDIWNRDKTELVVWAIPKETTISEGDDILISVYFKNTTDAAVFLPYYGAWTARISGKYGRGSRLMEFPGRRHPLADKGISAGETLVEEVTVRSAGVRGDFLQVKLYFGLDDIAFESMYFKVEKSRED